MIVIESVSEMAAYQAGSPVVLVPTMGALHDGHGALVEAARVRAGTAGTVVVSLFVNPAQFGPGEDFDAYPRAFADDCSRCEAAGADVVFHPSAAEMYPAGRPGVLVVEQSLAQTLCGPTRPGHFDGVCTVVAKLFHLVRPDISLFGKKDYQQLAILRHMVTELNFPIEIVGAETVREPDGLAMSSRNRYLTPEEREQAPWVRKVLLGIRDHPSRQAAARLASAREQLAAGAPLGRIDYLQIVDRNSMAELDEIDRPALAAAAVFFGKARLIDNIEIG